VLKRLGAASTGDRFLAAACGFATACPGAPARDASGTQRPHRFTLVDFDNGGKRKGIIMADKVIKERGRVEGSTDSGAVCLWRARREPSAHSLDSITNCTIRECTAVSAAATRYFQLGYEVRIGNRLA